MPVVARSRSAPCRPRGPMLRARWLLSLICRRRSFAESALRIASSNEIGISFEQVEQRLVESLHAKVAALAHDLLDLADLALEDHVGDQRRVQQHFDRRNAARAHPRVGDQPLRDQTSERFSDRSISSCERRSSGKKLMIAVQRLVGAVGVQRGQGQVAGLGKGHPRAPWSRGRGFRPSGSRRVPGAGCS